MEATQEPSAQKVVLLRQNIVGGEPTESTNACGEPKSVLRSRKFLSHLSFFLLLSKLRMSQVFSLGQVQNIITLLMCYPFLFIYKKKGAFLYT